MGKCWLNSWVISCPTPPSAHPGRQRGLPTAARSSKEGSHRSQCCPKGCISGQASAHPASRHPKKGMTPRESLRDLAQKRAKGKMSEVTSPQPSGCGSTAPAPAGAVPASCCGWGRRGSCSGRFPSLSSHTKPCRVRGRRSRAGSNPCPLPCSQGCCTIQTCLRRPAMLPAAAGRQGPGAASCGESNLTVLSLWGLENPHTAPRQETLHPALQRGSGQAGGRRGEVHQPKRAEGLCPPQVRAGE